MSHLPTLIADLALILISASVITLLFKWMKQALVLGYIIAGLLAGPYINIFPHRGRYRKYQYMGGNRCYIPALCTWTGV